MYSALQWSWLSVAAIVAATAAATLLVAVLVVNLRGGEKRIERRVVRQYALDDPAFADELGALLGPAFVDGCQVEALQNGDQIFPAMLAGIRSATASITFETFIYWAGDIGLQFADALTERSRHGVEVHVLLDWLGCAQIDESLVSRMTDDGVQVCKFHAPHWSHLARFNNRTHRKLLVIDGRLAFTGGVGIAPPWNGHAQDPAHWRDSHFQIQGPVVAQLQAVFLDNWIKATGDVLHGPRYFPTLAAIGTSRAQVFSSSPSGGSESMQLMYLLAITAASRSIDLSAAYFVPNPLAIEAFIDAMRRGVAVRIIVPGKHIDKQAVRSASRATWGALLAAGAVIAEYQPTMFHCKMMVVDSLLVSVGSTNFDNRSFRLNDEATLNIVDADFAAAQRRVFDNDLRLSLVVTLAAWQARPWHEKIRERAASLISAQL